jgi:Zn-dependent protease with chaperone function
MRQVLAMLAFSQLAGCSINPTTGRDQFLALPAAQRAQADLHFAVLARAQRLATPAPGIRVNGYAPLPAAPDQHCIEAQQTAKFVRQVERVGAELSATTRGLAAELFQRIDAFQIEVYEDFNDGTGSSASARIALSSQLARIDPTDDVVAFLIAREMGHIIARHDEEDSGVRMAFSVLLRSYPGAP